MAFSGYKLVDGKEVRAPEYDIVEDDWITDEMIEEAERKFWGPGHEEKRAEFKERLGWLLEDDDDELENDPGETKSAECPDFSAWFKK